MKRTPPRFTDGTFHNLGIGWNPDTRSFTGEGRYAVTKDSVFEGDPGSFKTPTRREVSRHAPYMHDGSIPTQRDVVEFYNRGGIANPDLDDRLRRRGRLGLTPGDANDLVISRLTRRYRMAGQRPFTVSAVSSERLRA